MKKHLSCLLGIMAFICAFTLQTTVHGQAPTATINLPQGTLVPGTTIQISIKLNGTNVGIWQYLMHYNRNVLSFQNAVWWTYLNSFGSVGCNPNYTHSSIPGDTVLKATYLYLFGNTGISYNNQTVVTFNFLYKGGGTLNFTWAYITTGTGTNYVTYTNANPYNLINLNTTYTYSFAPLTVGSVASSQTICYNNTPVLLTGTPPSGGVSPYTYQWQNSSDNISFVDIPGATGLNYQPGQLTANTWYRQVQTSSAGVGSVTTSSLAITVNPAPPACSEIPTVEYGGITYHTVQIGDQCWMKENLNIGKLIDAGNPQTDNDTIEKYCYDSLESNCAIYGGLYQWEEMMQYVSTEGVRGICPEGWHIPSSAELTVLETFLGGSPVAGGPMKEFGTSHWNTPNNGGTNCSGFTALAGGYSDGLSGFNDLLNAAVFWTSNANNDTTAWSRALLYTGTAVVPNADQKTLGFSVRCIYNGIPVNKTIENITIPQGQTTCFNALQTITVAGNGTFFQVQNGGIVTMIAGQNILYLPGTEVGQGGYMRGYIAPGGPYCQTPPVPAIKMTAENEPIPATGSSFRVYPNPTDGIINIDPGNLSMASSLIVQLFTVNGNLISSEKISASSVHRYTLAGKSPGVYFLRLISGESTQVIRIIKL